MKNLCKISICILYLFINTQAVGAGLIWKVEANAVEGVSIGQTFLTTEDCTLARLDGWLAIHIAAAPYISYSIVSPNFNANGVAGAPTYLGQLSGCAIYASKYFASNSLSGVSGTYEIGESSYTNLIAVGTYFIAADPEVTTEPTSCCENPVGDPINAANGSVFTAATDLPVTSGGIGVRRFFSSGRANGNISSDSWRFSFSRHITPKYSIILTRPYLQSAGNSSTYTTPDAACNAGFNEIRSQNPTWEGASALYSNGVCQLSKSGTSIGTVPVYTQASGLAPAAAAVAYDLTRDDGQLVRFIANGADIDVPPGIKLTLTKTTAGFTVNDSDDNIETYDTSGKLMSIISRAGIVQTMSYDASGRLDVVSDNFGHQLTLSYDGQGRVVSVTRQ